MEQCIGTRVCKSRGWKLVNFVGDLLHLFASLPGQCYLWSNFWVQTPNFETFPCISLPCTFCLRCLGSGNGNIGPVPIYVFAWQFYVDIIRRYCVGVRIQTGECEWVFWRVWTRVSVKVVVENWWVKIGGRCLCFLICKWVYFFKIISPFPGSTIHQSSQNRNFALHWGVAWWKLVSVVQREKGKSGWKGPVGEHRKSYSYWSLAQTTCQPTTPVSFLFKIWL